MEVAQTHGDGGVLDEAVLHEFFLHESCHLFTGESLDLEFAQYGEVDASLGVHRIIVGILRDVVGAAGGDASGEIEELGDLRVLALHADIEFVGGFERDHLVLEVDHGVRIVAEILEIGDVLGCGTR